MASGDLAVREDSMPRLHRIGFLAIALLIGCGSDSTDINQPGGQNPPGTQVSIVVGAQSKGAAAFSPNPLTITLADGGVARWLNNDSARDDGYGGTVGGVAHNITADDGSFDSDVLAPGNTFQTTYATIGTYGYHCSIHPTMKGTVIVTP
jgi:hypothetical protein